MIAFFVTLFETLLGNPIIRTFLEGVAVKVFAELLLKTESDPQFKSAFLSLGAQLDQAKTPEAKRAILKQMQALRANPAPAAPSVQPQP